MSKVAIVGVEGSGKTVLMGALCECYKQISDTEPYLMPENQAAFMFMERIPHKLRVEREWPEATNVSSLKSMRWTLRLGTEVLEEIEMLDYPGELYRIAFGERTKEEADAHRAELNEFLEHLTSADALIVLLNIADIRNLGANNRNAETVWITRGIFDYAKKLPNIKRTALMFTQADRFEATLQAAGGAQGLYAKQLPMLKTLYPDLKVSAVSAVSGTDGEGRPKEGYSTAGCLEVMREILWERDAEAQRCLALCENYLERVNGYNCGSPEGFCAEVTAYSNAVADLVKNSKPLTQIYAKRIECHLDKVSYLSHLNRVIMRLCSSVSADVLANRTSWSVLRETHEDYGGVFSAFQEHYQTEVKRQKQTVLDGEEEARKRAAEAAKEKQQAKIFMSLVAGFVVFVIGFIINDVYATKVNNWEAAKAEYETAVTTFSVKIIGKVSETDSRLLLDKYGGNKWKEAQEFAELGKILKDKDIVLAKQHYGSAVSLMPELTTLVLSERTKEETARIEEENRRKAAEAALLEAEGRRKAAEAAQLEEEGRRKTEDAERLAKEKVDAARPAGETYVVALGDGVKLEMVWCPAGSFIMGSPESEDGRNRDETQHRVTLTKGVWMGKTEVTQRQWLAVIGTTPSTFKGADLPVESVSWEDCQDFFKKLNEKLADGRYRLPTEAEWEYACRAGTTGPYAGELYDLGYFYGFGGNWTHVVGQKRANAWGLYDMHGNVSEWCEDWYGNYTVENEIDPKGSVSGSSRVIRGGCWLSGMDCCRSADRYGYAPEDVKNGIGFRVALPPGQ